MSIKLREFKNGIILKSYSFNLLHVNGEIVNNILILFIQIYIYIYIYVIIIYSNIYN